jgi:hypothetical protein
MDWHKLQHKLFEMDPVDPREDLARLQGSLQNQTAMQEPSVDYINESVDVPQGSLGLDKNYSVSDFAALAGVRVDEKQKKGPAGQLKGQDKLKKQPAGSAKNPTRDKLVGSVDNDARVQALEARVEALEAMILEMAKNKKPEPPKQRNPVATHAQRSGAGAHTNKEQKTGRKAKHKGRDPAMESLKEHLYRLLDDKQ